MKDNKSVISMIARQTSAQAGWHLPLVCRMGALCVATAGLNVGVAAAQTSLSVAVGAVVPIGGTADVLNSGYHATLAIAFRPISARYRLRIDGMLSEMLDKKKNAATSHQVVAATANLVVSGTGGPGPSGYVIAGVGSYHHSGSEAPGAPRNDFGGSVGAGIHFPLGFLGAFVESRLHYVADGAKTKLFPIAFGFTF